MVTKPSYSSWKRAIDQFHQSSLQNRAFIRSAPKQRHIYVNLDSGLRAQVILKLNLEIKQDEDGVVYKDLESIGDDLPDHSPRFILLSYPCTLPSGRLSVPYVLIFYLPPTVNAEQRMLYAGAKELMRNTAEVSKVLEIESVEDLEEIPGKLKGDER
ncbi:hypothetical protein BGAL_0025g00160 [Botrytis galanthina]|uniref:ADF-H domain-containing protein n=1 Tax=Botrytis galanthina TaxID=278940 RepID=A0A4V4HVT2_9HELO|nr:hypothetical protein BGAL_0025g00160 [Botrytis galanthina]